MKKVIMVSCVALVVIGLCGCNQFFSNKSNGEQASESTANVKDAFEQGKEENDEEKYENWLKSLPGKDVYVKNKRWWIDGVDMKVQATTSERGESYVVESCETDNNGHLLIGISNGQTVDMGPAGEKVNVSVKLFQVVFEDDKGKELSTQKVRNGESAKAPEAPEKKGYTFERWSGSFEKVTSDITVKPIYVKKNGPIITVEDAKGTSGDKDVTVKVSIKNNPGILGMTLSLNYDDKNLKLTKIKNGDAFGDEISFTKAKTLKNGCKVLWDGQDISKENIKDGTILVLTFHISDKASKGNYTINASYNDGDVVDKDLHSIGVSVVDGKIVVS